MKTPAFIKYKSASYKDTIRSTVLSFKIVISLIIFCRSHTSRYWGSLLISSFRLPGNIFSAKPRIVTSRNEYVISILVTRVTLKDFEILLNTSFRLPGNIFSCKDPPGKNILFVYSRLLIIPCSVVPEIVKCLIAY